MTTSAIAMSSKVIIPVLVLLLVLATPALSQPNVGNLGKNLQFPVIESKALAGNLIGDPSRREMAVLLPPSYYTQTSKHYPVAYLLHGLGYRKDGHRSQVSILTEMYDRMKKKNLQEMILVAVDGSTIFGGSYFANSATIGNFEEYTAREIVALVDKSFRTIANRGGRAIAGFSMGGALGRSRLG